MRGGSRFVGWFHDACGKLEWNCNKKNVSSYLACFVRAMLRSESAFMSWVGIGRCPVEKANKDSTILNADRGADRAW